RRVNFLGPNSLQIGGQAARTRGGDEQVTAEVEIERGQAGIVGAAMEGFDARRSGQGFGIRRAVQVKMNALEIFLEIGDMRGAEGRVRLVRGALQILRRGGDRIRELASGKSPVIGGGGNQNGGLIRPCQLQGFAGLLEQAGAMRNADTRRIFDAAAARAIVELAGHQQGVVAVGDRRKTLRTIQTERKSELARLIGGQMIDNDLVRGRGENLARIANAAAVELDVSRGRVEVQFAAIVGDGRGGMRVLKIQMQIAEDL